MKVGVVDIGTNSMRLLITDGIVEVGRWVEVTGLGRGVDASGVLSADALDRTVAVLTRFGFRMNEEDVERRRAVATSATRDARNREEFMDRAATALGVRPEVITGDEEGRLSYTGATARLDGVFVVSDIGGGSTEFVTAAGAVSIDIGSVRLSDRILADRPATAQDMTRAHEHVLELFSGLNVSGDLIGVAGTWTSLAAIDLELAVYDRSRVHHHQMDRSSLTKITHELAEMTVAETAAIPSLDPARAPVILAGAVVAVGVIETVGADSVLISEQDSLDGLAGELLALT